MLESVLNELHNWFVRETLAEAEYTVSDGSVDIPGALPGQYFRVVGSVFNDGLHRFPAGDLTDETFTGYIQLLAVPPAVISLADEIAAWREKNPESAITSESFGGYAYSRATGASGAAASWQDVFKARLNPYRKLVQS